MVALRFSRDKRGYEHFYIVQSAPTRRGKPTRTQILYWFRTPPNVRVGREPFDEEMRRALETQNPGVTFDWKKLIETPIPPPGEPEPWRERRRAEKAAKQAARAEEAAEAEAQAREQAPADLESEPAPGEPAATEGAAAERAPAELAVVALGADPTQQLAGSEQESQARRRRRRRRGRRGPRLSGMTEPAAVESREPNEPRAPAELPEQGEEPKV